MNSAYRDSGVVAARQQRPMGFQTVLMVCGVHINIGVTLNLLFACMLVVDVEPYRLTVQKDITGTAAYVAIITIIIISSGSPPVFHDCTSLYQVMVYITYLDSGILEIIICYNLYKLW